MIRRVTVTVSLPNAVNDTVSTRSLGACAAPGFDPPCTTATFCLLSSPKLTISTFGQEAAMEIRQLALLFDNDVDVGVVFEGIVAAGAAPTLTTITGDRR